MTLCDSKSHTCIFPSWLVQARYFSSWVSATAHTSPPPLLFVCAGVISKSSAKSPEAGSHRQTLTSPPKPTDTAVLPRPPRGAVAMWWVPSLWASRDWEMGKEPEVSEVRWTLIVEEPLPERRKLRVAARENMSVVWAGQSY